MTIRTFNTICHSNKYKSTVLTMTGMDGVKGVIQMPLNASFKVRVNQTSLGVIYTSIFTTTNGKQYMYSCEEARFTDYFYTEQQLRDLKINTILGE